MATPAYIGSGQPQAGKSVWSGLTSWFGGSAPAYKPAPSTPSSTSSTKTSTTSGTSTNNAADADASETSAQPTRVIIIVPHGGFIPAVEWPDSQQQ